MRILICGLNYYPECIGTAVYTTGLAEFLSRQGHVTTVVTGHPYYPEWEHRKNWAKLKYVIKQEHGGPKIIHCPIYVPARPSFKKRIVHYFSFLLSSFPVTLWTCICNRPDVVIAIAPSLVSSITALVCGRLFRSKVVIHVQDFEVDAAFATNAVSSKSFVGKLALAFESWMLRRFDMVSTISNAMLKRAKQKGVPSKRLVEFRNWADISNITPLIKPSIMRESLNLIDRYVILYSGNISVKQGLDIIPQAARQLRDRKDIVFVICGNGSYLETLQDSCVDMDNIMFIPLQPLSELSDLLGMADIHLLPQIADFEELVLPSKLANMLASGRPIVATANAGSALADEVEGCGIVVPAGNSSQLARAIAELVNRSADREFMGQNGRQRALSRWDANEILSSYEEALKYSCPA